MQILVVVTHLLGTGHLKRCINLAQAFASEGHTVTLASGGFPVEHFSSDGVSLIQLPPLGSDGTQFTQLVKADGTMVDDDFLLSRCTLLSDTARRIQPAVVITELFPFGRRVLHKEFLTLLDTCMSLPVKPVVLASVRDILSPPSTDKKARNTEALIAKYYDGVLVHSDKQSTPLDLSWPVTDVLAAKLYYTGYVTPSVVAHVDPSADHREIIVSAGGGAVGTSVFEAVIEAAQLTPDTPWRLLVGGNHARMEIERLRKLQVTGAITIEPVRADFRQLLRNAKCSVSLCGYNTAVDLLQTGTPGVFIPFDEGGELEQVLRAQSLSQLPNFAMLLASDLTPERLLRAIESVWNLDSISGDYLRFDGAAESVRIAVRLVAKQTHIANKDV